MLLDRVQRLRDDLRAVVSNLDPDRVSGSDAATLLACFAEVEKLAAGGRILVARRVEVSNVWQRTGHRSAAAHIAQATGTGLGPAIDTLETARRLPSLPATDEALRQGRLSQAQATVIAGAAAAQPGAERALVDAADTEPFNTLRLRCRRVEAASRDERTSYERVHRSRFLRHWTEHDGGVRFDARLTPDDGARVLVAIRAEVARLTAEARKAGVSEPERAVAADALVALARRRLAGGARPGRGRAATTGPIKPSGPGSPTEGDHPTAIADGPGADGRGADVMVHVRVDHAALVRGHAEPGELCEIPGVGPIPVDVARRLAADAVLSVLVTDGVDVTAVAHRGRTIPAAVRRALVERDPTCVVPGCEVTEHLEVDHLLPFAEGGPTELANLARLCHWHHYLKTHQGYRLERDDGRWRWLSPSPPDRRA
jgi:hypothetical protein